MRRLARVLSCLGIIFLLGSSQLQASHEELNTFQERYSSHIPMFDIDPRFVPRELRPPSYMRRLDTQRNITEEIRIDNIRIDWFNHRLELFVSGFVGDPYFIRVSQDLPHGGSILIPNTDVRRPTEGELIIFSSHAPMIFPNLVLERGRYYTFTIFDNHNVPQDSFQFRSPYYFDSNEVFYTSLVDIYGEGKDKKYDEVQLAQTNDPITLMTVTFPLMIVALLIYVGTLIKTRRTSK